MKKIISSFLIIITGVMLHAHPLHLTISNIDITGDKIMVAIQLNKHQLDMLTNTRMDEEHLHEIEIDSYHLPGINYYINDNFKISSKQETINLEFVDYEVSSMGVWLKYQAKWNSLAPLTLINTLFIADFSQQKNLLIVRYNEQESGFEMDLKNNKQKIFPLNY